MSETAAVKPFGVFAEFNWSILAAIVITVFCVMYFYVRRQKGGKHVDKKAGDEGDD